MIRSQPIVGFPVTNTNKYTLAYCSNIQIWMQVILIWTPVHQLCFYHVMSLGQIRTWLVAPWLYVLIGNGIFVNDNIKDNPMNTIKLFNICGLVTKGDDVPVVVGSQHRPICEVLNRMVLLLWSVMYTRCSGLVQCDGTCHTNTGYVTYITHYMSQFGI